MIEIVEEEVKYPSGKKFRKKFVKHPGSVLIIPFIDKDRIILLKQYRYTLKKYIYELPAGTIESGETPEECARRELIEETGYDAKYIRKVFELYIAPGYSDEVMHVFLAKDLTHVHSKRDEDEEIILEVRRIDEILDMIRLGTIRDSKTIASLLYLLNFVKEF